MFRLDNKQAIVTGAGSGIGYAVSETLAKQGAHVYLLDLTYEIADAAAAKLRILANYKFVKDMSTYTFIFTWSTRHYPTDID